VWHVKISVQHLIMASATRAQITRWQQTTEEVEARSLSRRFFEGSGAKFSGGADFFVAWAEHEAIGAALGDEYDSYRVWLRGPTELAQIRFFARVTPSQHQETLLSVDYDSSHSIFDFQQFNSRPNKVPINIGRVGSTSIRLCAEPALLQAHELEPEETDLVDDSVADRRAMMPETIRGLYDDTMSYRIGKQPDEGSSEQATWRELMPQAPLEVFHQLGGVELLSPSESTESNKQQLWEKSNYVLVQNMYDDSICVLWRKHRFYLDSADVGLAQDMLGPSAYAMFPGTEDLGETIIYAKIADYWDMLASDISLEFSPICRAPSAGNRIEEPLVVWVVRTKEGGLRRLNDFRTMRPRKQA